MNPTSSDDSAIDSFLNELEKEEATPWEQDTKAEAHHDWFEQAAADFLAKPEVDATLEEILEATKQFTRKNFALRAGLLYRQQLQNTPSYETIMELEPALIEFAAEANGIYEARASADIADDAEADYKRRLVQWAANELLPKLEGTKVVKVTRSTKRPKNMLADCPPAMFAQLGIKYKELLEQHISPSPIHHALAHSVAGCNVREWMGQYTGRDTAPDTVLIAQLWTASERKQWLYGIVEYATELVNLVAHATALDSTIKPRKYLCYFQKKSESTLYRGQEELEALVKNMQADKLLPTYETGEANSSQEAEEWNHEAQRRRKQEEAQELVEEEPQPDPQFATHAKGEDNEQPLNTATKRLRERLAARRKV